MSTQQSHTDSSSTPPERDFGRPFRLTAGDLVGDLLWPKLFRVPALTLRPDRIGLAVLVILLIGLLDQTLAAIASSEESPATPVVEMLVGRFAQGQSMAMESVSSLAIGDALLIGWSGAWGAVTSTFDDAPWRSSFVLPISFLIYITFAVGISRMGVDDFARGKSTKWTEALAWSVQGFASTLLAHLLPILAMALIVGVLAAGGFVLLWVPGLNVVGAVVAVLGVALAFVGVLVLIGFGLGAPMLSPAIASDGFDGIDAVYRVASFIFCKPGRFAIYSLILFVQFAVVASIAAALATATSGLASWGMGLIFDWVNIESGQAIAAGTAGEGAAARVVELWLKLPALIAGGFMLGYWINGWSVQYLLLRQAADGQDVTDIYVPGEMEARIERALASRVAGINANQSDED